MVNAAPTLGRFRPQANAPHLSGTRAAHGQRLIGTMIHKRGEHQVLRPCRPSRDALRAGPRMYRSYARLGSRSLRLTPEESALLLGEAPHVAKVSGSWSLCGRRTTATNAGRNWCCKTQASPHISGKRQCPSPRPDAHNSENAGSNWLAYHSGRKWNTNHSGADLRPSDHTFGYGPNREPRLQLSSFRRRASDTTTCTLARQNSTASRLKGRSPGNPAAERSGPSALGHAERRRARPPSAGTGQDAEDALT